MLTWGHWRWVVFWISTLPNTHERNSNTVSFFSEQLLLCLENWIIVFKHSWLITSKNSQANWCWEATGLSGSLIPSHTLPFQLQSSLVLFTSETWDFVTNSHQLCLLFTRAGRCYLSQLRVCRIAKSHNPEISPSILFSRV